MGVPVEESNQYDKEKLYSVADELLNANNFEATLGTTSECELQRNIIVTDVSESDEVKDYYEKVSNILDENTIQPSEGYTEIELSEKKRLYNAAEDLEKEENRLSTYTESSSNAIPRKKGLFSTEIQSGNVVEKGWKQYNWDVEHTRTTSENGEVSMETTKEVTGKFL